MSKKTVKKSTKTFDEIREKNYCIGIRLGKR
jgi:hypothetical protein